MSKLMDIPGMGVVYDKDLRGMRLFRSTKDELLAEVERVNCLNYNPCSVCNKCMQKGWHLYEICNRCEVPPCTHKQRDRGHLIKPKNFTYKEEEAISKSIETVYNNYKKNKLGGNINGNEE